MSGAPNPPNTGKAQGTFRRRQAPMPGRPADTATDDDDGPVYDRPTITVYPLKANQRPVGFAAWPEPTKPKRKTAAKRARKKAK